MNENIQNTEQKDVRGVRRIGVGAKSYFTEFVDFIRTQGVVGFATGFILGGAVSTLVKSFIENLVNPILGVLLGRAKDLSDSFIPFFGSQIMYGQFINDLIGFIVLAAVVYFGVKKIGLDRLDKQKEVK
jgi:large conductance mechanosensitive channel